MDGNGRWAASRGHARVYGHVRGAARVKPIVKEAKRLGADVLTLFAFSTENWKRPPTELRVLWRLLVKFLQSEVEELHRENVRLRVIGEIDRLPLEAREVVSRSVERLNDNTGIQLVLALSYGSRRELARAAALFAADCAAGKRRPEEMQGPDAERLMEKYLWTSVLGDLCEVDLVIRTSGEHRVSNFLLWQGAYAEYMFFDECWPDFGAEQLRAAVAAFQGRERRFGGLSAVVPPAQDVFVASVASS